MEHISFAHVNIGHHFFNIVPLHHSFGSRHASEQSKTRDGLQHCCDRANIIGTVLIAWLDGSKVEYTAPTNFTGKNPHFRWHELFSKLNRQLLCDDPEVARQNLEIQLNRPLRRSLNDRNDSLRRCTQ